MVFADSAMRFVCCPAGAWHDTVRLSKVKLAEPDTLFLAQANGLTRSMTTRDSRLSKLKQQLTPAASLPQALAPGNPATLPRSHSQGGGGRRARVRGLPRLSRGGSSPSLPIAGDAGPTAAERRAGDLQVCVQGLSQSSGQNL